MISLQLLNEDGLKWAQATVKKHHYLHTQMHSASRPEGYAVMLAGQRVGCLLFGWPQAQRCLDWYGDVEGKQAGRYECSRWEVINLGRVYLDPSVQAGGVWCHPDFLPGFRDRRGVWRSALASTVIEMALKRIVADYLVARPPCFVEEPYQLAWCLSYCQTRKLLPPGQIGPLELLHRGTIYQESGFEQYETGNPYVRTWRRRLRPLTEAEDAIVRLASERDPRAQEYRAARTQTAQQIALGI